MLAHGFRFARGRTGQALPVALVVLLAWCVLWLSQTVSGCVTPKSSSCWPCQTRCSEGLSCHPQFKHCYDPEEGYLCDEASAGGSDSEESTASGGSAGEASGSGGGRTQSVSGESSSTGEAGAGSQVVDPSECSLPGACVPQIVTPHELPSVCAGDEIELRLEAQCACDAESGARTSYWSTNDLPDGLSLSPEGLLSGSVAAGDHVFRVHVAIDGDHGKERSFELSATDRCFVLFAAQNETTGKAELQAHWLGTPETKVPPQALVASSADATAVLSSFDIAGDGRHVAMVLKGALGDELYLFRFNGRNVEATSILGLDGTLGHIAHAFSRDSSWLALVVGDEQAPTTTTLHLISLGETSATLSDSTAIDYVAGLTWSDANRVLYFGESAANDQYWYALEFDAHELLDQRRFPTTRVGQAADPNAEDFQRFVVGKGGFLSVYQTHIAYFSREADDDFYHETPRSLAPGLEWMVRAHSSGARIDPPGAAFLPEPFAVAVGCSFVLGWSLDGSKLLCHEDWVLFAYDVTSAGGQLKREQLMISGGYRPATDRLVLSQSGSWLALTPTEQGLVVVPAAEFATHSLDTPVLERPEGTNEWDFFFTTAEDKLIVQHGRQLRVAQLTASEQSPQFGDDYGVTLPPVPPCRRNWFPDPTNWCGSPRFRGNLLLSPTEERLAFATADGTVMVAVLATGQPMDLGKKSESCLEDCIQFQ